MENGSGLIGSDERFTPPEVIDPLMKLFGFELDPFTTDDNPLVTPYFYTIETDGFAQSWKGLKTFVNPPYSMMLEAARKAILEADKGAFVAFLIPNDCSTKAWKLLKEHSWGQWDIPFRVKFLTAEGKKVDVARSHVCFFLGRLV